MHLRLERHVKCEGRRTPSAPPLPRRPRRPRHRPGLLPGGRVTGRSRPCCCCTASPRRRTSSAGSSTASAPVTTSWRPTTRASGTPRSRGGFTYSFDALAEVIERFIDAVGLRRFVMYVFDFGGPVGFRLATRHPEWIAGLVVQNANAYEAGLSDLARAVIAQPTRRAGRRGPAQRAPHPPHHARPVRRWRHRHRAGRTRRLDPRPALPRPSRPPGRPGRLGARLPHQRRPVPDVAAMAARPPAADAHRVGPQRPLLPRAGAHAYLTTSPTPSCTLFDTGHFALEENCPRSPH